MHDLNESLRMIANLSPSERVIWMSMKGYVPRLLQRVFEESCRRLARDEAMSSFSPKVLKRKKSQMAENSKIGWTTHTANLWWGCVEVAPECDKCYAREWAKRYDRAKWGADEPRLAVKSVWQDLNRFQRDAAIAVRVDRVFCGSMMDIFEKPMPVVDHKGNQMDLTTDDFRRRLFEQVIPNSPNLLFLLLTKRPANIPKFIPKAWAGGAPANVMFGTSVGSRQSIPQIDRLKQATGRRFLSLEPLLEDIASELDLSGIEWCITGIESLKQRAGRFQDGYEAAARKIKMKCEGAGALYYNKQMPINGRVSHDLEDWPTDLRVQEVPQLQGQPK